MAFSIKTFSFEMSVRGKFAATDKNGISQSSKGWLGHYWLKQNYIEIPDFFN